MCDTPGGGASILKPQIGQWLRAGPQAGLVSFAGCSNDPVMSSQSVFLSTDCDTEWLQ